MPTQLLDHKCDIISCEKLRTSFDLKRWHSKVQICDTESAKDFN